MMCHTKIYSRHINERVTEDEQMIDKALFKFEIKVLHVNLNSRVSLFFFMFLKDLYLGWSVMK